MENQLPVIVAVVAGVLSLLLYVLTSLGLGAVFAKLGERRWKAWVPVVNTITILRLGGRSPFWVIATFFPVVGLVGTVFVVIAVHGINRRLQRGGGFTVLAVLLFTVWALVLGFGSAEEPRAPEPEPTPIPRPEPAAVGGFIAPPPVTLPPPPAAIAGPAITGPPITPSPSPPPHVAAAAQRHDRIAESTVVVGARPTRWVLELDGAPVPLTSSVVVIGRNPSAASGDSDAQLVSVADDARSVSKTHARLELARGTWRVTDLDSTNGVEVADAHGAFTVISANAPTPVVASFAIGDVRAVLRAEA